MIKAVSFQGTQPPVEKKEPKKSNAAGGLVAGAVIGAAGSYFSPLGKKAEFADVATFVNSDKMAEAVKEVPADKAADVEALKAEQEAIATNTKNVDTKLEAIFGKDAKEEAEVEISKVLDEVEGKPKFEDVKATTLEGADKVLIEKEKSLSKIKEEADKVEKGKEGSAKIKDSAIGTEDIEVKILKDAEGKVTFTKGNEAAKSLEDHSKEVSAERKAFDYKKTLADKLGITKETADATGKVKKSVVKSYLDESAKTVSEGASKAFDNIKGHLPKKLSGKLVALYTAGFAIVGALIGGMMKKKES